MTVQFHHQFLVDARLELMKQKLFGAMSLLRNFAIVRMKFHHAIRYPGIRGD